MDCVFGVNDEGAYFATRDKIAKEFGGWLLESQVEDSQFNDIDWVVGNATMLLDWRFNYSGGNLSTWKLPDLTEFLLEWFPRKVMIDAELAAAVPDHLAVFFEFLSLQGIWSQRSSKVPALRNHLQQLRAPFARALVDTSRFGMGKSLFSSMSGMGVQFDINDPDSISALMQSFNELPFDVRGQILGNTFPSAPRNPWDALVDGIEMTPAPVTTAGEVEVLAKGSSVIRTMQQIAEFCEQPRKLTKAGRLTVADGRSLAGILGFDGHVLAEGSVRSVDDLLDTTRWLEWAREVGVYRKLKGTFVRTVSWQQLSATKQHAKATDFLLTTGPLTLMNLGRRSFLMWMICSMMVLWPCSPLPFPSMILRCHTTTS